MKLSNVLHGALVLFLPLALGAITVEAQPYAADDASPAAAGSGFSYDTCAGCENNESSHQFVHSGHDCENFACETGWFQCDTECHTWSKFGSCEDYHTECFFEEDRDALELALQSGEGAELRRVLGPLAAEQRLTYLPERGLLLVGGCTGSIAGAFPVPSGGPTTLVVELLRGSPAEG